MELSSNVKSGFGFLTGKDGDFRMPKYMKVICCHNINGKILHFSFSKPLIFFLHEHSSFILQNPSPHKQRTTHDKNPNLNPIFLISTSFLLDDGDPTVRRPISSSEIKAKGDFMAIGGSFEKKRMKMNVVQEFQSPLLLKRIFSLRIKEEARMKMYSVSTKFYFSFGCLVSEEVSHKIKVVTIPSQSCLSLCQKVSISGQFCTQRSFIAFELWNMFLLGLVGLIVPGVQFVKVEIDGNKLAKVRDGWLDVPKRCAVEYNILADYVDRNLCWGSQCGGTCIKCSCVNMKLYPDTSPSPLKSLKSEL
uniref:MORF/ORRM1/DAG-like MORF domain-containing protein n=1 Tax=Cucumis melo TaxID=3656 RepID=A0A9I9EKI8_CUCME